MENVNVEIQNEAFNICDKYLNSPIGKKEIKYLTNDPEDVKLDTLLFKNQKTLYYLQKLGIIKFSYAKGLALINLIAKENRKIGILEVNFDELKVEEFVKERLAIEIDRPLLQSKSKKMEMIPFETPPNTKWENITIKFIDGHYVDIIIGKKKKRKTFREMGFEDSRTNKPDVNWKFLENLSETNGEIAWGNKRATNNGKKLKQKLSDGLKMYFNINSTPFYKYTKKDGYRIKIRLIPIPSQNKSTNPDQDIQDLYSGMTPSEFTS